MIRPACPRLALVPKAQHEYSDHDHGQGKNLSHGQRAEDKPDMGIRLTKKFHNEAAYSIAGDKAPKDRTGWCRSSSDRPKHDKQEQPFQTGFIQLRRVPTSRPSGRKDHAPSDVGSPSVEFSVNEVAQAAESQADRRDGCGEIRNRIDGDALASAKPD